MGQKPDGRSTPGTAWGTGLVRGLTALAVACLTGCVPIGPASPRLTAPKPGPQPAENVSAPAAAPPTATPSSGPTSLGTPTVARTPRPSVSPRGRADPVAPSALDLVVVQHLLQAGIPIADIRLSNAASDPDDPGDQPAGYESRLTFRDRRLTPAGDRFQIDDGGSVEIFPLADEAESRRQDLQTRATRDPEHGEYDFRHGPILLRLSRRLTLEQAAAYDAALRSIRIGSSDRNAAPTPAPTPS